MNSRPPCEFPGGKYGRHLEAAPTGNLSPSLPLDDLLHAAQHL
ncbi:MAG: hypothetical protein WD534_18440 [Phycisphaeraceae bacterium]